MYYDSEIVEVTKVGTIIRQTNMTRNLCIDSSSITVFFANCQIN